jgi:hypothetical protein
VALPQLAADKANHVVYGVAINLAAQKVAVTLTLLFGIDTGLQPKDIGLLASAAFGVGKELVDLALNRIAIARGLKPIHGVEPMDALATFSGGLAIWTAQA